MKVSRLRVTETIVGVVGGLLIFGSVASAQEISNTGPDSRNEIKISNECDVRVDNDTDVRVTNNNPQTAVSGDAEADENTTNGSVSSGDATNSSSANFNVDVNNATSPSCAPKADRPTVTPTEVTPDVATTVTTRPVGGQGAGPMAEAQVMVPVGGVGAGSGGPAYLSGLIAMTLATGAWGLARARQQFRGQL